MVNKESIVSKITQILFANQGKWRNLKVDTEGATAFIDLELKDKSLTIEVKSSYISFSFNDGWHYFTGNPLDANFTNVDLALEYLQRVINFKRTKSFDITYKGKEYQGIVELKSVYPDRAMGTERLYDIMISDGGVTFTVAELSEYPEGAFTIYQKNPTVEFSETELMNFIKKDSDLFFHLTYTDTSKKIVLKDDNSYLVIKKIIVTNLLHKEPNTWSRLLMEMRLWLEIKCSHMNNSYTYPPVSLDGLISPYHKEPIFDVSIIIPPQETNQFYSNGIISLIGNYGNDINVKIVYSSVSGAEIKNL